MQITSSKTALSVLLFALTSSIQAQDAIESFAENLGNGAAASAVSIAQQYAQQAGITNLPNYASVVAQASGLVASIASAEPGALSSAISEAGVSLPTTFPGISAPSTHASAASGMATTTTSATTGSASSKGTGTGTGTSTSASSTGNAAAAMRMHGGDGVFMQALGVVGVAGLAAGIGMVL